MSADTPDAIDQNFIAIENFTLPGIACCNRLDPVAAQYFLPVTFDP